MENKFFDVYNQFKGKGEKYDFIVPFTGGKDSSYVLYYMAKKLNARVLALTWDNGLIREKSWENIYRITRNLNVDLHIVKWDHVKLRKLFHATFKRFNKVCYCPFFVFLASSEVAITKKIPAIITGFSEGQREMNHSFSLASQEIEKERFFQTTSLWETFFGIALKVYDDESISKEILNEFFEKINHIKNNLPEDIMYPHFLPLSNYVRWTSFAGLEQTLKEIGWQNPAKTVSHSSCMIEPIKGYIESKHNLNELRAEISYMIRCGGITRDMGIEELEKMSFNTNKPPENLNMFCNFIFIDENQFLKYLTAEKTEYPTPELQQKAEQLKKGMVNSISWIMGVSQHKAKFY
ncbi:MAG: hypothetical protein HXX16_15280 [Bacteroidales bacterium]|nr:hypothetical protein [Bacteroidales bacterium]